MFNLTRFSKNPCLDGDGYTYTYEQVYETIAPLKNLIDGRRLIVCLCENTLASLLGYIGFLMQQQVLMLVDAEQKSNTLLDIIACYAPSYVWLSEERSKQLGLNDIVFQLHDYVLVRLPFVIGQDAVIHQKLQVLLSTSGTTGSSKFVRLSLDNLQANAKSIISYLNIQTSDVAITTLPFNYSFGLSIINTHLMAGASIQVTRLNPLSRDFWEIAQKKGVTSLSGVPYTFDMLRRIKFERFKLDNLRYLSQAGGRLGSDSMQYLLRLQKEKNMPSFVMYGQTEATARMSYLPAEYLQQKIGSIGLTIPGGRFELTDEQQTVITAPNVKGELIYYGPNVGMGYAKNREDLALDDQWSGRLCTGDIAYRDEDGFYYIAGRLNRFIKVFGNRVSLDEVEIMLQSNFAGGEFVCSGQDDTLLVAYVGEFDKNQITVCISKQLGLHHSVINCAQLEEIPRLGNGKINYSAIMQPKN